MKLSQQFTILIFSIMFIYGAFNAVQIYQQSKRIYSGSEIILVETVSQSLANSLAEDVITGNKLAVTEVLKKIQREDNSIQFIYITDLNNNIFAHSFQKGFPEFLLQDLEREHAASGTEIESKYRMEAGLVTLYRTPLINGLNIYLHLGISQERINQELKQNTYINIALNIVAMFVALVLGYWLSRKVTKPLSDLTEHVEHFGTGGLDKNIGDIKYSSQEVRVLSDVLRRVSRERHNALLQLQEREQDLSITLNSIGDAVIATDKKGNITRMNPVAQQMTGWTLDEAKGKSVKTVFPIVDASTRQEIPNPIEKVIESGETVYLSNHTTLIAKDGTEYQISDSAAPIRNAENEILGMVLIFNDVTEQYRLRQLAAKSKRDLQAIMDNSPAVIYTKDIDGKYVFINNKFENLFHISRDEIVGKTDYDIFPEKHAEAFRQNDLDVIEAKQTIESEEIAPHDDGPHTYISNKFPLFDEDGNIYAVCGISTDITERIKENEQLRHAQRMEALGKLTGGIAHDYNNMLGIILDYSEVLEEEVKENKKLTEYVYEIRHAGERGAQLTKRLLNFSKNKVSKSERIDINRLLQERESMLQKTLTARIEIDMKFDKDLWPVWIDISDLEDAIVNMSINASHAMEGQGRLTIETKNIHISTKEQVFIDLPPGDYVLLSVTDTGCGMDDVTRERLFDPFYSTKDKDGTGLGLSQVYGFVERSKGAIKVYSEEGHGSRFMLYFPRYKVTKKTQSDETIEADNKSDPGGHETILLVDDEPVLLKLTTQVLTRKGYTVISASSASQALQELEKNQIDLMISDVIMPDMDGYALAAVVKEKYPQLKIQLASGFADDRGRTNISSDIRENILQKPYNLKQLFTRVRELLDQG